MSQISDLYTDAEDFESHLEEARMNAQTDWEEQFIADVTKRYVQYGAGMYLSPEQHEQLLRIGGNAD